MLKLYKVEKREVQTFLNKSKLNSSKCQSIKHNETNGRLQAS